eukprot:TRINITY_DN27405_c0_g1_i1.p1 TRINITY_DN27405_c0_g1~~TRINITY_DN27405_c0_g1_i1.p1  ORF type:complete len:255 (+),score=101.75 TRINITY_DN27405_c0_g1_i1:62-766(+)
MAAAVRAMVVLACAACVRAGRPFEADFDLTRLLPKGKGAADAATFVKVPIGKDIPAAYQVVFKTDVKDAAGAAVTLKANVTTKLAPLGAEHFYRMVKAGVYDGCPVFRVVPGFVAQFGIPADPEVTAAWSQTILDDRVLAQNVRGTLAYAHGGADTRSTQVFVNMDNNAFLDKEGFSPFADIVEGLDAFVDGVVNPTPGKPEGLDQAMLKEVGMPWVKKTAPETNVITKAFIAA